MLRLDGNFKAGVATEMLERSTERRKAAENDEEKGAKDLLSLLSKSFFPVLINLTEFYGTSSESSRGRRSSKARIDGPCTSLNFIRMIDILTYT